MLDLTTVGAVGNGMYDNWLVFQDAIDHSSENVFYLPKGVYRVSKTLNVRRRGIKFAGNGYGREEDNATTIVFSGGGTLFEIGEATTANYAGFQGFKLQDIAIENDSEERAELLNPYAQSVNRHWYGVDSYAVKDWRGGGMVFENVQIERFEVGIWGVQSDLNKFTNCNLFYNMIGMHMMEGSDQLSLNGLYFMGNDMSVWFYGCNGFRMNDCNFVKEGTEVDAPIMINFCNSGLFSGCWFEGLGHHGVTVPAFVEIGRSVECRSITFRDSTLAIADKQADGKPVCDYFISLRKGKKIFVDEISGHPKNLRKIAELSGNFREQHLLIEAHLDFEYQDGTYVDTEMGTSVVIVNNRLRKTP